jgi:transposase
MQTSTADAEARIAQLEAELAAALSRAASESARVAELERERDSLRASHERLRLELELLKLRMFVAKAERVDTTQLKLEFAEKLHALDTVAGTLGMGVAGEEVPADVASDGSGRKRKRKSKGRRDLKGLPLEERRVEIADPVLDRLVEEGKAERIGHETSYKLSWQRGGMRRLAIARVKYRTVAVDEHGDRELCTAMTPAELIWRCLAAPSLLAHLLIEKYCDGLPFFRIEQRFSRDGVSLDRGTMSRWAEDIGATLGASIVEAMRAEALRTAFCIATDATGIAVQPIQSEEKPGRQACRRGHFFVQIADRDAIFFEYTARETSAAVGELFKGFSGYIQADAKSVYDALFEEPEDKPPDGDVDVCREVACWSHARRGLWEATVARSAVAREGLARICRIFELDAAWAGHSPEDRKRLRDGFLRPHVDAFFAWVKVEHDAVKEQRGLLRSALGYLVRQKDALCRFFDDGRLELTNNRSERALRNIAVGRKAWLFCGSDDHAQSAGQLFTLIATARLHRLDPEAYLRDVIRVLPHWPKERYLELAPKFWAATRARLLPAELDAEVGVVTVPPAADAAAEQQSATS